VGEWLDSIAFAKASWARQAKWTAGNVNAIIRRTIYRGFEINRKKVAKRQLRTGKSEYVWNDEDKIQTCVSEHLRIVPDWRWYKANEVALPGDAQMLVVGFDALPLDLSRPRQLFFQPFDLHLQAADLLVEFLLVRGLVGTPLPPVGEQLRHLAHKLLLPGRHLARVDAELARQLGRRSVTLGGGESHLRLNAAPNTRRFPAIILLLIGCLPPGKLHFIRAPEIRGPPQLIDSGRCGWTKGRPRRPSIPRPRFSGRWSTTPADETFSLGIHWPACDWSSQNRGPLEGLAQTQHTQDGTVAMTAPPLPRI
jgi:hypothetical protein